MAKKKTITADGYKIDLRRNIDGLIITFDFVLQADGDEYTLRVDTVDQQTSLVQKVLRKVADLWPARDMQVLVAGNDIVDVPM